MTPPFWFEMCEWWCYLLKQKRLKKEQVGGKGVNQNFHFFFNAIEPYVKYTTRNMILGLRGEI